ncbi:O-succinylbenzoic acid--CoA ligase [Klebsiella pneumoniae]|uniref:O-succinylbenzoic acid--CoA ligase n=1 Tax=Klebsiella pneumoniae TaxID=573 RepID=A0A377U1Q5_KLEPN|nr:O-succinylbenzoic acid--CoA ligase [Klebsiella pneumoniae]
MRLLAWRSVGVDDVDLRFNRPAESGVHSANAHLASAAGVLALMPFAAGDDWLLSLPLFHVSGQGSSGAGCWPARDSRYVTNSRWRRCCTAVPMLRCADSAMAPAE